MSFPATAWAWTQIRATDLQSSRRMVLLCLADRHNQETGRCDPGIETICSDTGMNRKTVMEALRDLEMAGMITVVRRNGAGSTYSLAGITGTEIGTGTKNWTGTEIGTTPVPKTGPVPVPKTVPEPGIEPGTNQEPPKAPQNEGKGRGKTRPQIGEDFEQFYRAYPRKAARADAEKAWLKIRPNDEMRAKIMAALDRARNSRDWLKDDGKFIPYPASWLNKRRWEDETTEGSGMSGKQKTQFLDLAGLV